MIRLRNIAKPRLRGQVMTEWLLIAVALVAALLAPAPSGEPMAVWLLRTLIGFGAAFVRWVAWI
jgi:hypothetical protein